MDRRTWMVGLVAPALLVAADWPQFRGPNAAGVSQDTGLPLEFGPNKNVIWKTTLPPGHSSPALAGSRIFITAYEGDKLLTFCLERATSKILWRRDVPAMRRERLNKLNDRASPTPVTDGNNVYSFFGDFGLVSYGPDGGERWRMPLGPFTNLHGMAASPLLVDGKIIQICDQDNNAYLLVVNKDDGRVTWKTERSEVTHGFSTPVVYRPAKGPAQLIVPGSYVLIGYAADTGEKLWWVRGTTWQVKSAPVIGGDTLYFTGWARGGDAGEQLALPPFEEVLSKYDANHDGKIAQSEIPKEWWPPTWSTIDLDKDGLLNPREWSFYRSRRASANNLMAVRLGGKGDVTDTTCCGSFASRCPTCHARCSTGACSSWCEPAASPPASIRRPARSTSRPGSRGLSRTTTPRRSAPMARSIWPARAGRYWY